MKPRLLDLFSGAGGAARGYQRAGFYVVGVDIKAQPRYAGDEFIQADAMTFPLDGFDVIHASPPCQAYTWAAKRWTDIERADLAGPTRARLEAHGGPYVIENVEPAGRIIGANLFLCGQMFGLGVIRHRVFAVRPGVGLSPQHPRCLGLVKAGRASTVAGHGGDTVRGRGGHARMSADMGIDWMEDRELKESIPPAYTTWIGEQLMRALRPDGDDRSVDSLSGRTPDTSASPDLETGLVPSTGGPAGNGSFGRSPRSGSAATVGCFPESSRGRDAVV